VTHEYSAETEALVQRGMAFHHEGRLDEARSLYRQALDREPLHFDAWHWLGVIAFQTNQPKLAVEILGKALVVNPQSAAARNHQGNALLALGEFDPAIRRYDHAIVLKPDPRGTRSPLPRVRVLLLQHQLQDHACRLLCVDGDTQRRAGQCAVSVCRQYERRE
jgi:tetratricopeptide (TPR) repeat protein